MLSKMKVSLSWSCQLLGAPCQQGPLPQMPMGMDGGEENSFGLRHVVEIMQVAAAIGDCWWPIRSGVLVPKVPHYLRTVIFGFFAC